MTTSVGNCLLQCSRLFFSSPEHRAACTHEDGCIAAVIVLSRSNPGADSIQEPLVYIVGNLALAQLVDARSSEE